MSRFRGVAHIVAGDAGDVPRVVALLREEGFPPDGADVYARAYTSFGVDEARDIALRAVTRAVAAPHRAFVIAAGTMTIEAQNALLKTLEDAPGGAAFFLIVPNPDALLATVRSRTVRLALPPESAEDEEMRAFLRASPAQRIDMLKPLLEQDERDVAAVFAFLSGVERVLAPHAADASMRAGLDAVYRARRFAGDKGSLLKPLLEHVALLTPVV
jgi:DNA polymerase-3 subunit delta'